MALGLTQPVTEYISGILLKGKAWPSRTADRNKCTLSICKFLCLIFAIVKFKRTGRLLIFNSVTTNMEDVLLCYNIK
jgi:hypothetical protein